MHRSAKIFFAVSFAVVLLLIAGSLMGLLPGSANGASISQSAAYWQKASPFAIMNFNISGKDSTTPGNAELSLQNIGGSAMTLTGISLSSYGRSGACNVSTSFMPGEEKEIGLYLNNSDMAGAIYKLGVNIDYISSDGANGTENGTLMGRYS